MTKKSLKENKFFIIGATAFLSGALSFVLSKFNETSFLVVFLGNLLISFIYVISTLRLSLSKSLVIAVLTSIILYNFSLEAAINLLEMAFLGSFVTEIIQKDIDPKIGIPFVSVLLTILGYVEIQFGHDETYKLVLQTIGPYLFGFLFIVSSIITYIVYYLALIYIKKTDIFIEKIFYPRYISFLFFSSVFFRYILKGFKFADVVFTNLFLILAGLLLIEGLTFGILILRRTKSFIIRLIFFIILFVLPYLFLVIGIVNNLFKLHQKILLGGKE